MADRAATQHSAFQHPHILNAAILNSLSHAMFPCDTSQEGMVPHAIILTRIDKPFVSSYLCAEICYEPRTYRRTPRVYNVMRRGTAIALDCRNEGREPVVAIKGIKDTPHNQESRMRAQSRMPLCMRCTRLSSSTTSSSMLLSSRRCILG